MTTFRTVSLWVVALAFVPIAAHASTFAQIVNGPVMKLGNAIISLIYALCFIFFLIGMVQYFMSHNAEKREQGKYFAIYGIVALAILFVTWGLVRFLIGIVSSFNT